MKHKIVANGGAGLLQKEKSRLQATGLFIQELMTCPKEIGAVLPSSRNLSLAMADWLPENPNDHVLELGPGTGSVTEALFERGLREDRLIAIEQSERMAELLRARFPRARIITGDAFKLDELLKQKARGVGTIGAVVSSLPLLNFHPTVAGDLLRKIHTLLPPDGRLVQYSYRLFGKPRKPIEHLRPVASRIVWVNMPPARVSVYAK